MNANEDYLDSLLKSVMGGENVEELISADAEGHVDKALEEMPEQEETPEEADMDMEEMPEQGEAPEEAAMNIEEMPEQEEIPEKAAMNMEEMPEQEEAPEEAAMNIEEMPEQGEAPEEAAMNIEEMPEQEEALEEAAMTVEEMAEQEETPEEAAMDMEEMAEQEETPEEAAMNIEEMAEQEEAPEEAAMTVEEMAEQEEAPEEAAMDMEEMAEQEETPEEAAMDMEEMAEQEEAPEEAAMDMEEMAEQEETPEEAAMNIEEMVEQEETPEEAAMNIEEMPEQGELADIMTAEVPEFDLENSFPENAPGIDPDDIEGDVTEILSDMEEDADLAEINDLLKKSDDNVFVDGEMDAEEEPWDSGPPEEDLTEENLEIRESGKEKKPKKRKWFQRKKKKNKKGAAEEAKDSFLEGEELGDSMMPEEGLENSTVFGEEPENFAILEEGIEDSVVPMEEMEGSITPEGESGDSVTSEEGIEDDTVLEEKKKPGFLSRILNFLTEEDELEEAKGPKEVGEMGTISEENLGILEALDAEGEETGPKKKGKKEKKPKKEKEKKEKKPKGEKKERKPKKEKQPEEAGKSIPKKKIILTFVMCFSLTVAILLICTLMAELTERKEARAAFNQQNYKEAYQLLYGKELADNDLLIYNKTYTLLQLYRRMDSYEFLVSMDEEEKALDSLIQGVAKYHELYSKAEEYGVVSEYDALKQTMLDILFEQYSLSEDDVNTILEYDELTYTKRIQSIINGTEFVAPSMNIAEDLEDVLPAEEEFLGTGNHSEESGLHVTVIAEDVTDDSQNNSDETINAGGNGQGEMGGVADNPGAPRANAVALDEQNSTGDGAVGTAPANVEGDGTILFSGTTEDGSVSIYENIGEGRVQ